MNTKNITNKKWYVLSFLSLILATVGGHAAKQTQRPKRTRQQLIERTVTKPEQAFEAFMGCDYLRCKFPDNKYYKNKNAADPKGTNKKQRKMLMKHLYKPTHVNKAKLTKPLRKVVATSYQYSKKDKNNDGKEIKIEFAAFSEVAKYLSGLYRLKDDKKKKKEIKNRVDSEGLDKIEEERKFKSLKEAKDAGLGDRDYQLTVQTMSMHVWDNMWFGAYYYSDEELKTAFDALMGKRFKDLIKENEGKGKEAEKEVDVIKHTIQKSLEFELEDGEVLDEVLDEAAKENISKKAEEIVKDGEASEEEDESSLASTAVLGASGIAAGFLISKWYSESKGEEEQQQVNKKTKQNK